MYDQDIVNALHDASLEGQVTIPARNPQSNCDTFGEVSLLDNAQIKLTKPRGVSGFQTKTIPNVHKARVNGL